MLFIKTKLAAAKAKVAPHPNHFGFPGKTCQGLVRLSSLPPDTVWSCDPQLPRLSPEEHRREAAAKKKLFLPSILLPINIAFICSPWSPKMSRGFQSSKAKVKVLFRHNYGQILTCTANHGYHAFVKTIYIQLGVGGEKGNALKFPQTLELLKFYSSEFFPIEASIGSSKVGKWNFLRMWVLNDKHKRLAAPGSSQEQTALCQVGFLLLFGSRKLQILLLSNFRWSHKAFGFSVVFFSPHKIIPTAFSYHQMVLRRQKSILAEAIWWFFCLVTQKIYSFRIWETEPALGKSLLGFVTVPILQPDFKFQDWSQNETTRIKWFPPIWHHLSKKLRSQIKNWWKYLLLYEWSLITIQSLFLLLLFPSF